MKDKKLKETTLSAAEIRKFAIPFIGLSLAYNLFSQDENNNSTIAVATTKVIIKGMDEPMLGVVIVGKEEAERVGYKQGSRCPGALVALLPDPELHEDYFELTKPAFSEDKAEQEAADKEMAMLGKAIEYLYHKLTIGVDQILAAALSKILSQSPNEPTKYYSKPGTSEIKH